MQVRILQLVTPGLARCSAMFNVGATIVNLPRIEIHMRSPSVMDMLTEFATDEHLDMEGELAGRWDFLAQQQAMRVCVRLDMIRSDFVSRRLWPLEDGEATISNLCRSTPGEARPLEPLNKARRQALYTGNLR